MLLNRSSAHLQCRRMAASLPRAANMSTTFCSSRWSKRIGRPGYRRCSGVRSDHSSQQQQRRPSSRSWGASSVPRRSILGLRRHFQKIRPSTAIPDQEHFLHHLVQPRRSRTGRLRRPPLLLHRAHYLPAPPLTICQAPGSSYLPPRLRLVRHLLPWLRVGPCDCRYLGQLRRQAFRVNLGPLPLR